MTTFEELQLWYEIVQRTAVPASGETLSDEEREALARSCRVLAQVATLIADNADPTPVNQRGKLSEARYVA